MDIQFFGANCVTFTTKQARVVIDDNLADLGGKAVVKQDDIVLFTMAHGGPTTEPKILIDHAGEYEVSGVSIYGIPARSHLDEKGKKTATMYKLVIDDLRVLVTGHIYPELNDKQLEQIGMIDVIVIPVGGNGYTLDPVGALQIVKKVEPKLIIPTHYDKKGLNYPVPQQSLEDALKILAIEQREPVAKLKLKSSDLGTIMQIAVLES